jgi:hypothetical protein
MAFLMYPIAVTQHSAIYNGSRQFLFMVPAFTMMAVLGVWRVVTSLRKHPTKTPWPLRAVWVVVGLGLVLPVVDQVRLFPYNYVYFNEVARLAPIDGNWPTDYWRASGQDLIRRLPADGPESCWVVPSLDAVRPCQNETQFAPFWDLRGKDARAGTLGPGEYWLMRENGGDTVVPDSCELFDRVSRPLGLQTLTIGQILKCSTTS